MSIRSLFAGKSATATKRGRRRSAAVESLEPRAMLNADPIWVGGVYVEEDRGGDDHGDTFYVSFAGGAANTQLKQVVIDGDQATPGFGTGDNFFDTASGGLGTDHAHPFRVLRIEAANPAAKVTATVADGGMRMTLDFENFYAGDVLVFEIDVDEVEFWDPAETNLDIINSGFDPITSGVEFQTTKFQASFASPHYEDVVATGAYWNSYDSYLVGSNLELPGDNEAGLRDRTAGTATHVVQTPKPISLAGRVWVDNNRNLQQDAGETYLANVQVELYRQENGITVATGHRATTDAAGRYEFPTSLGLMPGVYEIRQTQPVGYYSVGAVPGVLASGQIVGETVAGNTDILALIAMPLGDFHARELNFAEAQPASIAGFVYADRNDNAQRGVGEEGLAGVSIRLESIDLAVPVIRTTTTDASGAYRFENLQPGRYRVVEVAQPTGWFDGKESLGTIAGQARGQLVVNDAINEILLNGAEAGVEFNFGELPPGSLSGHVCLVNPGFDCTDTAPESKSPLPGVTVQLVSGNNVIATTTTDSDGKYRFENLPVGVYTIRELTPGGLLEGKSSVGQIGGVTNGQVVDPSIIGSVVLRPGDHGVEYNFCELLPSRISGQVFEDLNDDGIRQGYEPLIGGASVVLFDASGAVVGTRQTDVNGYYEFTMLGPGVYRLLETTPAGYYDGRDVVGKINGVAVGRLVGEDSIEAIDLRSGQSAVHYDFGELLPGRVGGRVIVDINTNNRLDRGGEMPLAGVAIELLDASGNVIGRTTTDGDGNYQFTGLRPGLYSVREQQPAGYFDGETYPGTHGGDASVPNLIRNFRIDSGSRLEDYDFTEIPPASLAGYVFIDNNGDCLVQPGERPIPGVTVELLDALGQVAATTTTGGDGSYRFGGLTPGRYAVREIQPVGYLQGHQRAGSGGGDASVIDVISRVDLAGGDAVIDYNFCEVLPASLGGTVFVDLDSDQVRDGGESLLSGVLIELLDATGSVIRTAQTDSNGAYRFESLRPGKYGVREQQPEGYFHGGQTAPAGRADTSQDDLLAAIDLVGGEHLGELDFSEVPPATISGYVFVDGPPIVNETGIVPAALRPIRDGLRDSGDQPLANVTLELRTLTGQPFPANRTMGAYGDSMVRVQTDSRGYFEFAGLRPGSYHVYQVQPDGYNDGLDTPGTTGGLGVNPEDAIADPQAAAVLSLLSSNPSTSPRNDAILMISVAAGQTSRENNFSEVNALKQSPPEYFPPPPLPPPSIDPPLQPQAYYPRPIAVLQQAPLPQAALPLMIAGGMADTYTWHLSIINSGTPRGSRRSAELDDIELQQQSRTLDMQQWRIVSIRDATLQYVAMRTGEGLLQPGESAFSLPDATPLAGDFNGDGVDELVLFLEGEWLIDLDGDGHWDSGDMWSRLGEAGDRPVVGDWDGDGKDDIGIFGPQWEGDPAAIAREAGLPDAANRDRTRPKNVPPDRDEPATERRRYLRRGVGSTGREDVIDHVFRQGVAKDLPVAGDFNGDGISTVGIFRSGRWRLDTDGNGRWEPVRDEERNFGQAGDIPVVGDFDGDGIDEIAVIRGGRLIVDSNHDGQEDATDRVFELGDLIGPAVVGDFDGDGCDEVAIHREGQVTTPRMASQKR